MDQIFQKAYDLNSELEKLPDEYKQSFMDAMVQSKIQIIDSMLTEIQQKMDKYKTISNLTHRRELVVEKMLFPYYWMINQSIVNLPEDEFTKLENYYAREN